MPRQENVIVVFVASPSDLDPERNCLEEVIKELNRSWSRSTGFRLELVRWETHGYPEVGQDPQDVLNRELPNDSDIFIGLMWSRYGTETGRAGSGTEEEFNRALERHRRDPESIRIMFYFKDAPLAPSEIDPDQLRSVACFRAKLGSEGTLYWTFKTLEDFEQLLRIHLSRQLQGFAEGFGPRRSEESRETDQGAATESGELGLLDFLDLVDEHFGVLDEITGRIGAETESMGKKMRSRTEEIQVASARGQVSRREARSLLGKAAADMKHYAARMETEVPLFRDTLRKGADAATQAALIGAALNPSDKSEASGTRQTLVTIRDSLADAHNGLESFKNSVQALPRLTSDLNRAKRETAVVLQDQLDSMAEGERIVTETIKALDVILGSTDR